jgi:3-oxosteroid 1-dehydrogenase
MQSQTTVGKSPGASSRECPVRGWRMRVIEEFDVVVVGSGAAALIAALRSADHGLSVLIVEKAHQYGGTTATSGGGLWIPNHRLMDDGDSREKALSYLYAICSGDCAKARVEAYIDNASVALRYLISAGLEFEVFPGYPDYFPNKPGATTTRAVFPKELGGEALGEDFHTLREQPFVFKLFNRYSMSLAEAFTLSTRPFGWQWMAFKVLARYWLDLSWRRETRRDRRLTMGAALIGGLRRALQSRNVPLLLNTKLESLVMTNERVAAITVSHHGSLRTINARRAVVLGAGGYEQSQTIRDKYLPVATDVKWSMTPIGANTGDALRAAQAVGAAVESMDRMWWTPTMQLPAADVANFDVTHQMFLDHRHPHSVCVNRLGNRFVDEAYSYDSFGSAMVEDHERTGANLPCWLIFDAQYRHKYTCGGLMPSSVAADRKLPKEWWNNYLFRANTLSGLAETIGVDANRLNATVGRMNEYAKSGVDPEFGRGQNPYDLFFGDPRVKPNPCLGSIIKPPFYAIRMDLGDVGTKGGLKADEHARVLDEHGEPISGLYAAGNCAAAPFGDAYAGAGGTLGPAATFAFVAANHIANLKDDAAVSKHRSLSAA